MPSVRRIAICIAIVLAMAHFSIAAESANVDAIVNRLQHRYQTTKSFRADFTDEIIPVGGMKRDRAGTIQYHKGGQMRWEFTGSDPETIVSDGKQLYDYQPDLNQVLEIPVEKAFRSAPAAAFLLGVGNVKREFEAHAVANAPADSLQHIVLKSRSGKDGIVELGIDPATSNIVTLKLSDDLGNVSMMRFTNIATDIALDDKVFAFEVPPGTDIVKPKE